MRTNLDVRPAVRRAVPVRTRLLLPSAQGDTMVWMGWEGGDASNMRCFSDETREAHVVLDGTGMVQDVAWREGSARAQNRRSMGWMVHG